MGGESEKIVIRGVSGFGVGDEKRSLWIEFHNVDLKQGGIVEQNCYPKLRTWMRIGSVFFADSKLFVLGCTPDRGGDEYASFLDLDSDSDSEEKEWKHLALPVKFLTLGTLDGKKIYGHNHLERNRHAEEDGDLGLDWFEFIRNPVPFGIKDRWVEGYLLVPDPPNDRILFFMRPGTIYAYYPSDREVRVVVRGVCYWSRVVAVAGDIVYIHDHHDALESPGCRYRLIHAYDLSNSNGAKAKYLECVWTSTVVDGVDMLDLIGYFKGLLHVPNTNNFWLAASIPITRANLRLHFVKFEATRTDDDRIICTPLTLVSSLLENTCKVFDFLLIHQSLNT